MSRSTPRSAPRPESVTRRLRLHGTIAHDLGALIVTGHLKPGTLLDNEVEASDRLKVSRTAYREAVRMLAAKGLVEARPKVGTRVSALHRWHLLDPDVLGWLLERKFSPALLMEFTEFRLSVEPGAAMLAARMAGPAEKKALVQAIARMQAADNGDDDVLDSDIAFHVAVLHASRNRFYAQLTGFIVTALRISIRTTNRNKGVKLASAADHKKVADAIIAGRPAAASDAMRKLIQEAMDLINWREESHRPRRLAGNDS